MKILKYLSLLFLISLTGCTVIKKSDIFLDKSTVFGLEISEPSGHARIRFGLVRNFYQKIPTSTNAIYSPVYSTAMDSTIKFSSQSVQESYSFGNTNGIK